MQTAVVTGGNRGIGYAVCEALAAKEYRVVAVCRDPAAPVPPGVEVVQGDLASRRTVNGLAVALSERCPTIDVLVHNAAVWPTRLRHLLRLFKRLWPAAATGAAPVVRLAAEMQTQTGTGRYFNIDKEQSLPQEPELARRVWDQARELTGAR